MRTLVFLAALAFAPAAHAQNVSDLAWLKGCWRTEAPREAESGSVTTEVWIAPPGPAMFGFSFTQGEGEIQGWEQMRIDAAGSGGPRLVASVAGAAPVEFRLREEASPTANFARFENPAHDYPQIVEYRRRGNRLTATISMSDGAEPHTYAYRRIRCAANLRP